MADSASRGQDGHVSWGRTRPAIREQGLRKGRRIRWGTLAVVLAVAGSVSGPAAFGALTSGKAGAPASAATNGAGTGTASSPSSGTHEVPSVLSGLSLAKYVSPAPASALLTVGVSAQRPDAGAVNRMYRDIYDPSNPLYHQFLTPAQFDQQFGLPSSAVSAIKSWLTADGLTIESVSGDGSYYTASGTVRQLDSLFDVKIGTYTFNGQEFVANNVAPSVPSALPVVDVLGLNTIQKMSFAPLTGATSNVPSSTGQGPQSGTEVVMTPQETWAVYNDPGAADLTIQSGPKAGQSEPMAVENSKYDLGQGQTMGIFGEGETSSVISQLRLFESAMGLPRVPVRTVYTEGGPGSGYGDNTGAIEWNLDSQASTGMAPDVSQLDFYFAKSLYDADTFQEFSYWANDPNGPKEMNASFGECEANPSDPITNPLAEVPYGTEYGDELELAGEPIMEQATIEGRTLFSSAGDTGSGCPEVVVPVGGAGNGVAIQPIPEVSYPCSSSYVVCVGGTVVSVNGSSAPQDSQRASETSWTFGGGGTSFWSPEPGFQQAVANVNMPCLASPQGDPYPPGSSTCRGVPDVADMSGTVTGNGNGSNQYFFYNDGEPSSEGGTSLSSPLMVGQWARVQAGASKAAQRKGGLGFADPWIYNQASSADSCSSAPGASAAATAACTSTPYAQDFTDITESEYGVGNGLYRPGPGWDYTSGWGAINVANFIADVDCAAQSDGCAPVPQGAAYSLGNWDRTKNNGNYTGTIDATGSYGGAESGPLPVTTATMDGPAGWSTDPYDVSALVPGPNQAPGGPVVPIPGDNTTTNYDPSLDITGATLTADASTVTATISGPYLGTLPPPTAAAGGNVYYVAWLYNGIVYFAAAQESAITGQWSYTSGNTGTVGNGAYNFTSGSAATGSFSVSGANGCQASTTSPCSPTVTIQVPASEVGSPTAGTMLVDPQAFDQVDTGTPAAGLLQGVDSADDLVPVSELQSSDCTAPRHRTEDNATGNNTAAGQQVKLCSLAESQGVAVEVQNPPDTTAGGTVGSGGSSVGPISLPGVSAPGGATLPTTPLLPIGVLNSEPDGSPTSMAKLP